MEFVNKLNAANESVVPLISCSLCGSIDNTDFSMTLYYIWCRARCKGVSERSELIS